MVNAHGVLFSCFLLLIAGLTQSVTPPALLRQHEDALYQEALGLEPKDLYASNTTVTAGPDEFIYLPASQSRDRIRVPRGLYNPLQKRDNYCFPDAPSAFCADSNLCCTDTAEDTGWCCWFTLNCGVENHDCITPTVVFTSTSTITSRYSVFITYYATSYGTSTVIETVTSTDVVTATNVATATEVEVTTITARDSKRARGVLLTDVACPESTPSPVASSTSIVPSSATQGDRGDKQQHPITIFVEPSHGLAKRQAVTVTSTVYTTVSETTTVSTTSVIDSTAYVTSTLTEQVTTTSALNAQTTVYVTSTYTTTSSSSKDVSSSPDTSTASSSSSTSSSGAGGAALSQDSGTGGGGGGGLGGGAVAGIAVGAAAIALIVAGIIAFIVYKRRKQRKAETLAATPAHLDSNLFPPQSDAGYSNKMAPAAAYDPRSRPMSYQHDYYPVPATREPQIYHEADGRMVGWEQMHEIQHPPAELAAHQRYGMNELPHDRH